MTKVERHEYDRQWRQKNRTRIKSAQARYRAKHRERILAERRARYAASPARREYNNAWNKKHRARSLQTRRAWNEKNRNALLLCFARCRARRNGIPFDLRREDIVIPARCPVFGVKLTSVVEKGSPWSPSLDRIVPSKGYVRGNVAVISLRANLLKNNASLRELQAIVAWLARC